MKGVERRAWGPKAPEGPWDVIVLGAGIGGLSAAALLSQLGKRVLVLEQHRVPGGFTQSFRRANWAWDVGLHVVGEMGHSGMAGRVLAKLSGNRLAWTRVPGAYDVVELPDGMKVEIPGTLTGLRANLLRGFPDERPAIERYFALLREAAAAMRDYFVARSITPWLRRGGGGPSRELALSTTGEVLDGLTQNPRLRGVLGAHWSAYGAPPSRSVFGIHALISRHYRRGAYYPVGGSMSIPRALSSSLLEHGGWVQVSADVEQIVVKHGHATGVRLASGEVLSARAVVSAVGAKNTLRLLPDEERTADWVAPIEALRPSCAHVCLYLGLRGDIRAAGASEANRWLMNDFREEVWDAASEPASSYLSFPSLKDGVDHGPEGLHTGQIVVMTDWAPFAKFAEARWRQRGAEYERLKEAISDRLLAALLKKLPALGPLVAYRELSTPASTAHFVRGIDGAAYGLEANRERFENPSLRPRTPVRGLHLAGCDVSVVGIAGALVGGLAAAVSIEPERSGDWLRDAVRPVRARGGPRP